jgi:hypothetical protein
MKKSIHVLAALLVAFAMFFSACEGPVGPGGANGLDGLDGLDGLNGGGGAGTSVASILDAGTTWVAIPAVLNNLDTGDNIGFSSGSLTVTGATIGSLTAGSYGYALVEATAATGTLKLALDGDGFGGIYTDVAEYTFNRAAGTLVLKDLNADVGIFTTTPVTYTVLWAGTPALTNGTYSYTNGSGIEVDKEGPDTAKATIVVTATQPDEFSDAESIFGVAADTNVGTASVALAYIGNNVYVFDGSSDWVDLGSFSNITTTGFTLGGKVFELQQFATGTNLTGITWIATSTTDVDLTVGGTADDVDELLFLAIGKVESKQVTSTSVAAMEGITADNAVAHDWYALHGTHLYIDETLVGAYSIDDQANDILTIIFEGGSGFDYPTEISGSVKAAKSVEK